MCMYSIHFTNEIFSLQCKIYFYNSDCICFSLKACAPSLREKLGDPVPSCTVLVRLYSNLMKNC